MWNLGSSPDLLFMKIRMKFRMLLHVRNDQGKMTRSVYSKSLLLYPSDDISTIRCYVRYIVLSISCRELNLLFVETTSGKGK